MRCDAMRLSLDLNILRGTDYVRRKRHDGGSGDCFYVCVSETYTSRK